MKARPLQRRHPAAVAAVVVCLACTSAGACEYYAAHFQIVHPSARPAQAGTSGVALSMDFVEIAVADRLIGASTPVADRVELVPAAALAKESQGTEETEEAAGIVLLPGSEVEIGREVGLGQLIMHGIDRQLHYGRQYPLTLVFEQAGEVYVEFVAGDH